MRREVFEVLVALILETKERANKSIFYVSHTDTVVMTNIYDKSKLVRVHIIGIKNFF
jgi:hypothetical protein